MRRLLFTFAAGLALMAVTLPASAAATPTLPAAPTVVTGSASLVTENAVFVTGTVTANGAPTSYSFEYGLSTSYGSSTQTRVIGHGHQLGAVRTVIAKIGGLTAGTEYHFRLVASNAGGTTNGADATFTTLSAAAPAVSTGSALRINATTAIVDGTVSAQGAATTYDFQYGTSTAYGQQTATRNAGAGFRNQPVAAALSSLTPNTLYHFRLVATNASGTTDGADQTFTTLASTTPIPTAPIVNTGAAIRVKASWAIVAGSLSPQGAATTYSFQYGTSTAYGQQTASHVTGPGMHLRPVVALIRGLTPNTLYHFRLVATNSVGTTDGSDQTFTTLASTTPPPVGHWFAGSVTQVGSNSLTVGVLWTGPHDSSLNGQTLTVSVPAGIPIHKGIDGRHSPISLSQIQVNDLVAINATGTEPSGLSATRIFDYCDCHFISGTIGTVTSTPSDSFTVAVTSTGPYDTVLQGQTVTMQTSSSTSYVVRFPRGRLGRIGLRGIRIPSNPGGFADLKPGEHVAVIFAANGFFKAPGFNPSTATFTASQVEVWGPGIVSLPPTSAGVQGAAQTSVSG